MNTIALHRILNYILVLLSSTVATVVSSCTRPIICPCTMHVYSTLYVPLFFHSNITYGIETPGC